MKRDGIDWHAVPEHQLEIHDRLCNWGRWCNTGEGSGMSPMFRFYRSTDANQGAGAQYGRRATANPVDAADAGRVQRAVAGLPQPHRLSLAWYYIKPINPTRACAEIGTNHLGLATLVSHGRQMLIGLGA